MNWCCEINDSCCREEGHAHKRASTLMEKLSSTWRRLEDVLPKESMDVAVVNLLKKIGSLNDFKAMMDYLIDIMTKLEKTKVEKLEEDYIPIGNQGSNIDFMNLLSADEVTAEGEEE